MNYLDRNNIASARLAGKPGMQAELRLSSVQWNVSVEDSDATRVDY